MDFTVKKYGKSVQKIKLTAKSRVNSKCKAVPKKAGFTLIEMIIVIAILAITAAIAIPSLTGAYKNARVTNLNLMAQTLFYSAQDALSDRKYADGLGRLKTDVNAEPTLTLIEIVSKGAMVVPSGIISDNGPLNPDELAFFTNGTIAYLSNVNVNNQFTVSDVEANAVALKAILSPYIVDNSVFDKAILIEFNKETAVVRGLFYSEKESVKTNGFTYDQLHDDKDWYILDRTYGELHDKEIGYFGVDNTGTLNLELFGELRVSNEILGMKKDEILTLENLKPGDTKRIQFAVTNADEDGAVSDVTFDYDIFASVTSGGINGTPSIENLGNIIIEIKSPPGQSRMLDVLYLNSNSLYHASFNNTEYTTHLYEIDIRWDNILAEVEAVNQPDPLNKQKYWKPTNSEIEKALKDCMVEIWVKATEN